MDSSDPQDLASLVSEVDGLVRGSRSFNLHVTILKRLLNLKDKSSGYEELKINTQPVTGAESVPSESNTIDSETFEMLKTKMMQLKEEVEKSQLLGLCLAYNVQRLQKYSTGSHVDVNSTERVVSELWDKYNQTKSGGAILRYEFEEKRRLLRRLRHELEQTRRDWQNFRVRRPEPESDQEKMVWQELRQAISRRQDSEQSDGASSDRPGSETDSAVHSDEGEGTEDSNPLDVFDRRRAKLDQLEEDCFRLVSDLVMKHAAPDPDSDPVDSPLLSASLNLADEESSSVEDLDPEELLLAIPDEDDPGSEEVEISTDEEAITPESVITTISSLLTPEIQATEIQVAEIQVAEIQATEIQVAEIQVAEIQVAAAVGDTEVRSRTSSHSSRIGEEEEPRRGREESVAETGEPIVLCRLRRKAVEILISRLREEKTFHETRENELRIKLNEMKSRNEQLQQELNALETDPAVRRSKSLALIGITVLVINIVAAMKVFF